MKPIHCDVAAARAAVWRELATREVRPDHRDNADSLCVRLGRHNPVHIDIDHARAAGFDGVFAQGLLSMAQLSDLDTQSSGVTGLRSLSARFTAVTNVHDDHHVHRGSDRTFRSGRRDAVAHRVARVSTERNASTDRRECRRCRSITDMTSTHSQPTPRLVSTIVQDVATLRRES